MKSDLIISDVCVDRNGFNIVRDVSLSVNAGAVTVLIGPNGAGKTTLLEGIMGIIPARGSISLGGSDLGRLKIEARAARGLALVEQGRTVFGDLTVEENLRVASAEQDRIAEVYDLFPELVKRQHGPASLLSGGEQQMLVIGRALVSQPGCLMLDEMSFGLSPILVKRLMPVVRTIADRGAAVLLVEQFAHLALAVGDHAYVLNHGEVVLDALAKELLSNPDKMQDAYLGTLERETNQ